MTVKADDECLTPLVEAALTRCGLDKATAVHKVSVLIGAKSVNWAVVTCQCVAGEYLHLAHYHTEPTNLDGLKRLVADLTTPLGGLTEIDLLLVAGEVAEIRLRLDMHKSPSAAALIDFLKD